MNAVVDALIVGLMTVIVMMAGAGLAIAAARAVWHTVAHRNDRKPIDDKAYDYKRMGELRTRFENREER